MIQQLSNIKMGRRLYRYAVREGFAVRVGMVTGVSAGASRDWQIGLAAGGLVVALESFVVGAVAVNDKFR